MCFRRNCIGRPDSKLPYPQLETFPEQRLAQLLRDTAVSLRKWDGLQPAIPDPIPYRYLSFPYYSK